MRNGRKPNRPTLPTIPREWTFYAALVLAIGWLISQLYRVQVDEFQSYNAQAVENRTRLISDPAPRGVIYDRNQVLLAAKAGASYVSPFVGRLDDISVNGLDLIADIMTILRNYGFATEVIVASVRSPMHVVESALLGADIATIPYKVIAQLAKHPLTDIGMQQFLADWEKRQK